MLEDKILDLIQRPPDANALQANYSAFDEVCKKELKKELNAKTFANRDLYFYRVEKFLDWDAEWGEHSLHELPSQQLGELQGKVGIYHIWFDHGSATGSDYIFQAVYVGKGHLNIRLTKHVHSYLKELGTIFITVHTCENRIAKYLEQLFLDTFAFPLNKAENTGSQGCFYTMAKWESATTGSDADAKALRFAEKAEKAQGK